MFRLFYPELEAVYEEKNLAIDSPSDRVWESLLLALFPAHPYGTQPTIGVTEHLKSPAYSDMVEYFGDWYVPNNMAVVLAGDIDAERALPVLEGTLGRWQPRKLSEPEAGSLEPVKGRVVKEVLAEAEQTVTMAWRTVPIRHEDEPALVVLDWLTDNSRTGLINLELELTQKVQDAGSWVTNLNEAGYFGMRATLQQGQTHAEVEALLLGVVAKLKAGEFTAADVETIKLHQDIGDKLRLESNGARVERMAESFIAKTSWGRGARARSAAAGGHARRRDPCRQRVPRRRLCRGRAQVRYTDAAQHLEAQHHADLDRHHAHEPLREEDPRDAGDEARARVAGRRRALHPRRPGRGPADRRSQRA